MSTPLLRRAKLGVFLLVLISLGCSALLPRPEPPRVTLADIRLADVKLLEQRYRLFLRIQNPNSFDLPIEGLDYELVVNDEAFGSGVSNRPISVPAYGTEVLEVDAYSTLAGLLRQFRGVDPNQPLALRYRLKGHVRLSREGLRLPFDHAGELSLGAEGRRDGISL